MCWNAEEAVEPDQRGSLSMFEQPNVYRQFETEEEMRAMIRQEMLRKAFFVETLMNPAFHWYFTQGQDALLAGLILPGISSLLNGI
jgi:hypothetical protein